MLSTDVWSQIQMDSNRKELIKIYSSFIWTRNEQKKKQIVEKKEQTAVDGTRLRHRTGTYVLKIGCNSFLVEP